MKNKAPAEVQITAEQLLREAKERELELLPPPPKQKITDKEELNDYKLRKRKVRTDMLLHALQLHMSSCIHDNSNNQSFTLWIKNMWDLFFKAFEDNIRKNRTIISNWIKYAQWEESLEEIQRCGIRSNFPIFLSSTVQLKDLLPLLSGLVPSTSERWMWSTETSPCG